MWFYFYFFLLAIISVTAFLIGKRVGSHVTIDHLAAGIRNCIRQQVIRPWEQEFRSNFLTEGKTHTPDAGSIRLCLTVAMRLYRFRRLFPEDMTFRQTHYMPLGKYITTCAVLEGAEPMFDVYFEGPMNCVNTFIDIIEAQRGKLPTEVWVNQETEQITDQPQSDPQYTHIRLSRHD